MQAKAQTNANIGVGFGALLQLAGLVLLNQTGSAIAMLGLVLILISLPPFIWGCMSYAEGKGHSKWIGLVGVAGIIGLIVLVVLPDHKDDSDARTLMRVTFATFMILGLILVAYGVEVDISNVGGPSPGPVPYVSMLAGAVLVVVSLVFLLRNGRR